MTIQDELLGLPTEKTVTIDERRWMSVVRLLARQQVSWRHCAREARMLLDECRHDAACRSSEEGYTCLPSCPDRERFLSARVVWASASEFVGDLPLGRGQGQTYIPPTREYFDRIIGELEGLRAARDWLEELSSAAPPRHSAMTVTAAREVPLTRLVDVGDDDGPAETADDEPSPFVTTIGV